MSDVDLTELELKIALMWENGCDTWEMAKRLNRDRPKGSAAVKESDIYGMLPAIRERRRLQRGRSAR